MIDNDDSHAQKRRQARLVIYAELVFVLIPLFYLVLKRLSFDIFLDAEWSLVASILFGQAAARLFSGIAKRKIGKWQLGNFYAIVCFGVSFISVYIYSLVQDGGEGYMVYVFIQFGLFILSLITFIVFGSIGQRLLDMPEK
jgi:hypothetical protein